VPNGRASGKTISGTWRTLLLCATTAVVLPAQRFTYLHTFSGTDGASPQAALIQATDGHLYGTTFAGGVYNSGTVFKITPGGTFTVLYNFASAGTGGRYPTAPLVQGTDGNFYGTTVSGGTNSNGTIFRITPAGVLAMLYSFCSQSGCVDGSEPYDALIQATDGNFYGTTYAGGAQFSGTIYRLTPGGTLTTLYSFCSAAGCTDGQYPTGPLLQAADGNLYGTTYGGGNGNGTIFRITTDGAFTSLHSFCTSKACGKGPSSGLVQGADGKLYGTTLKGGGRYNGGTIFSITTSGAFATLYAFDSKPPSSKGSAPVAAPVSATDGNLYGTTYAGGVNESGTIFRVGLGGDLTTLYRFCAQGQCYLPFPDGALVQDTNGTFYGTTCGAQCTGGGSDDGTIFSISEGLSAFVKMLPAYGEAGATVNIMGTGLTGVSSVSFNGAPAAFQVVSKSLITATVPAGASSGAVEVVSPSQTLESDRSFQVVQ